MSGTLVGSGARERGVRAAGCSGRREFRRGTEDGAIVVRLRTAGRLPADTLRALVEDCIVQHIDAEVLRRAHLAEQRERETLARLTL